MRMSAAGRSSIAGTSVRAQFSLFGSASFGASIIEITITNTTTTAFAAALARFTAATNVGSGLTEVAHGINPPQCTGFAGHTGDASPGSAFLQRSIGAAIGAGTTWSFAPGELIVPVGTANGIGIIIPTGTGQISDFEIVWDE